MPSWCAFALSAGTDRFNCLEILAIGVLAFECAFSAFTSTNFHQHQAARNKATAPTLL